MTFAAIGRHMCKVFWDSHFHKISLLRRWFLPLFPYAHAYSVIEPSVDVLDVVLHARNTVVVKPSSGIDLDFPKARLDGLYRLTGR